MIIEVKLRHFPEVTKDFGHKNVVYNENSAASEGWKMQILKEASIDVTNQQRPVYRGIDNFYQKS